MSKNEAKSQNDITREQNYKKILKVILRKPSKVAEISVETGLNKSIVYKHLYRMIDKKLVYKDNSTFYCTSHYISKKIEEEVKKHEISFVKYDVNNNDIEEHLKKEYKKLEPYLYRNEPVLLSEALDAEKFFWCVGTIIKLWNPVLKEKDYDFEVFLAVKNLIYTILKKADVKALTDATITVHVNFDPYNALQILDGILKHLGNNKETLSKINTIPLQTAFTKILDDSKKKYTK